MQAFFEIDGYRHYAGWVVDSVALDTDSNGETRLVRKGSAIPHQSPGHWECALPDGRVLSSLAVPPGVLFVEEDDLSVVE